MNKWLILQPEVVMAGLDPAISPRARTAVRANPPGDARVKPAHDKEINILVT